MVGRHFRETEAVQADGPPSGDGKPRQRRHYAIF